MPPRANRRIDFSIEATPCFLLIFLPGTHSSQTFNANSFVEEALEEVEEEEEEEEEVEVVISADRSAVGSVVSSTDPSVVPLS